MKIKRVIVQQFGYFWRLTFDQWIDLCRKCAKGEYYNLFQFWQYKRKPSVIFGDDKDPRRWSSMDEFVLYRSPLDWGKENWEEEVNNLEYMIGD